MKTKDRIWQLVDFRKLIMPSFSKKKGVEVLGANGERTRNGKGEYCAFGYRMKYKKRTYAVWIFDEESFDPHKK